MLIVHVHVHVKPDQVGVFKAATLQNARNSVQDLCAALKVQPLTQFGLKEQDFPQVVAKAQKSSSMKGNPIALTDGELTQILYRACGQTWQ